MRYIVIIWTGVLLLTLVRPTRLTAEVAPDGGNSSISEEDREIIEVMEILQDLEILKRLQLLEEMEQLMETNDGEKD